jgi:DNA-binding Lrp family transcriptional regulator
MEAIVIDDKDELILDELEKNARQATKSISRRTGIPRATVHERIKKLKKKGVIKGFTIIKDRSLLGLPLTAFVLVSFKKGKLSQKRIAETISALPRISEVHIIAGQWDLLLKAHGKSFEDIGDMVVGRLREMEQVEHTLTWGVFKTVKEKP